MDDDFVERNSTVTSVAEPSANTHFRGSSHPGSQWAAGSMPSSSICVCPAKVRPHSYPAVISNASPQPPACAEGEQRQGSPYRTSALRTTSSRKCRLRSIGVRRSTLRPPSSPLSSASTSASRKKPTRSCGRNSTSTSTSLASENRVRQDRSEQSQFADAIAPAQVRDFGFGDLEIPRHRHAFPKHRRSAMNEHLRSFASILG